MWSRQESNLREPQLKAQVPTPAPAPKLGAWEIPPIKCYEPEDGVFYAQMGPTGGKHGYSAITGNCQKQFDKKTSSGSARYKALKLEE